MVLRSRGRTACSASLVTLSVGIALLVTSSAQAAPRQQTPWERYLSEPSPENAARVTALQYSESRSPSDRERDLSLLEVQVVSGDREAVRLALRLLPQSDGHVTETLCIMLGRLIRVDPRLLLTEVGEHLEVPDLLDAIVTNFGAAYIDRPAAQIYEARQRINALESAQVDPELDAFRTECVDALRQEVRFLEQLQK